MSIFSRLRKATKGIEEPSKPVTTQTKAKPAPAPSKHVPANTTRNALTTPPPTTTVSAEEIRTRIAAARRMKSNTSLRTTQSPPHSNPNSRPSSEYSLPRHTVRRNENIMRLDEATLKKANHVHSDHTGSPVRGRQSRRAYTDSLFRPCGDLPKSADLRDVPRIPIRPRSYRAIRSMSAVSRMRSPLSSIAVEEEEEPEDYFSSSSQDTAFSARSSQSTSTSGSHVQQPAANSHKVVERAELPVPTILTAKATSIDVTFVPYDSANESTVTKRAKPTIPTWRYEDYGKDSQTQSTTTSGRKRGSSLSTMFRGRLSTSS